MEGRPQLIDRHNERPLLPPLDATIANDAQDWQRAAQAMSRVVELKPMDALAHFVFATCLDNLGNAKEAIVQYNKFLGLDDGSSDARSFQARQRAKTLERRLKR